MNWKSYEQSFLSEAKSQFVSEKQIEDNLSYAELIFKKGFPVIFDLEHFSLLVGYEKEYILRVCKNTKKFYRTFEIPKKNGKLRVIAEPLPSLKEIQNWILTNILSISKVSPYCKAYKKGTSIKSNAKYHRNREIVLGLDIENYFPSISIEKIKNYFHDIGYTDFLSNVLSKLCCLDDSLPQGAPTSPHLSNIVTKEIDEKIVKVVSPLQINYSRYADDLTFSGSFEVGMIVNKVRHILSQDGFNINNKKIRAQGKHQKQLVTGIVVNNKLQVDRKKRRSLRQTMYYIRRFGYENHFHKIGITKKNYIGHLIGLANHIIFINPKEEEVKGYLFELYKIKKQLSL